MNTIVQYGKHDDFMLLKKRNRVSHYREITIKKVITYAINHGLLTMKSPLITMAIWLANKRTPSL